MEPMRKAGDSLLDGKVIIERARRPHKDKALAGIGLFVLGNHEWR